MKQLFILFQTLLNFIALNVLLDKIANIIVPNSPIGLLVGILYWSLLLLLSYAIAVRFKNEKIN